MFIILTFEKWREIHFLLTRKLFIFLGWIVLFSIYYVGSWRKYLFWATGLFEAGNLTKGHFVTNLPALQTAGSSVGRVSSKFSPDLAPFTIPNSVQKKKLFDMVIPWVCLASAGHQIALWVCYLLGFKRKHTNVQSQHLISLKHSWIEGLQRNRKIKLLFFNRNQIYFLIS